MPPLPTLELGRIYEEAGNVNISEYLLTGAEKARIALAANMFSLRNKTARKNIYIHLNDFKFGTWDGASR
ncbi:MAG: hypothetical protein ACI8TX_001946 [Hyphomicrobiaceae bacterium]